MVKRGQEKAWFKDLFSCLHYKILNGKFNMMRKLITAHIFSQLCMRVAFLFINNETVFNP